MFSTLVRFFLSTFYSCQGLCCELEVRILVIYFQYTWLFTTTLNFSWAYHFLQNRSFFYLAQVFFNYFTFCLDFLAVVQFFLKVLKNRQNLIYFLCDIQFFFLGINTWCYVNIIQNGFAVHNWEVSNIIKGQLGCQQQYQLQQKSNSSWLLFFQQADMKCQKDNLLLVNQLAKINQQQTKNRKYHVCIFKQQRYDKQAVKRDPFKFLILSIFAVWFLKYPLSVSCEVVIYVSFDSIHRRYAILCWLNSGWRFHFIYSFQYSIVPFFGSQIKNLKQYNVCHTIIGGYYKCRSLSKLNNCGICIMVDVM
eukprot:TRINITY_DN3122_c1_g1_i3.p1 TRINITY_DN3122_c1_g1~~TRINITY_DN3122_c1_g1_i3.p1  ORF type:complete len:307 (+),score=-6.17 TRINITY_DN3122_c1_g1_i3:155-1075(+)